MPKSQGYRIGGKFYSRGLQTDRSTRPNDPSMLSVPTPPNFGRSIIPHAITFSGMTNTLSRAYRKADEALRDNVHNAHMMLNDPMVTEPLFAIQQMVSLFNWHIEAGDMKDPEQVALAAEVTKIIEKTPRFMMYRWVSLLGIWFGSYGIEHQYAWQKRGGRKAYYIKSWTPISGDKLHFRYDDGRYHYDPEQVGVRVSNAIHTKDLIAGDRTFEPTADGLAYFLQPWERDCWLIHKNFVMDGNFEDPLSAEKVHGVGLRSFVYWIWLLKQEALAQLTEVVERTARGFTIYWYPSGNAQARAEVEKIAQEQSHQNAILMPKDPELEQYGIDVVPADTGGITALQDLIRNHYGHLIKRVILGQTLSSESDATGLGSGVADLHMDTLYNVAAFHAANLEETITRDLVWPTRDRNYPQYRDVDLHFRIDTDTAKPAEELESAYKLWTMGARIKEQELMDKVGLSTPDATDRTLQNPSILQQMRLAEQAMQKDQFHPGDDVQPDLAGSMSQWLGGGIGPTAEGDDQGPMQMSEQGHPQKYFGPIRHSKSPWLDRVTAQKHAKEDWSPYTGPNGGTGWQNNKTGEIVYGDEEPWSDRKPAKDDDQQPPQGGSDDGGDQPSGGDPQPQQGPPSGANAPQVAAEFGYAGGNPYSFATTTARRMGYEADGQTQEERAAAAAKFLDSIHGDLRAVTDTAKTLGFKPSAKIATTNAIHAARYIVAQAETKGFKASTNDVGQNVRDAANFLHGNMANERPDPEPPPVQLTQGSSGSTALADSLGAILVGLVASAIGGQMGGIVSRLAHEWLKSQQPQTPAAPKPDRKGKTKDPTKPTNEAAKQALLELSGKVGFVPRLSPPPPAPKQPKTDKPAKEPRQPKEPKQKPASAPKASQPTPDDYGVKVRPTTAEEAAAAPKRHDAYAGLERLGKEKAGQDIASAGYKSLRDFTTAMQQKGLDADRVRKMYPKTSAAVETTYGGSLEDALGRSEPQEKRESPQAAINARLDEMVDGGELAEADKDAFRNTLAQAWDDMRVAATERETAKAEARRRLELTQADINRLENQGFDSGSQHKKIKGLDTLGREFASMYPGLGWGRGYVQGENHDDSVDYGEKLWSLIGEGKKDLPTQHSDEVFEQARGMFGLMEAAHAADAYGMEMPVFGDEEGEPETDQADDDFDFGDNKRPDDWDAMTEDERAEADPEYVPFRKWQAGLQERIDAADDMRQRYRKADERGDAMTASIYRAACNQADAEVDRYALTGNRKRRYDDSPGQQLLGGFDNHGHQGAPQFEESKHPRSPKGGMTVGGEYFPGGKFIPARAMANASKSELKQLGMDFSDAESKDTGSESAGDAPASDKHTQIAERFGIPKETVAEILNTDPQELMRRDEYLAPNSGRSNVVGPTTDYEKFPLGSAKVDSFAKADPMEGYVEILQEFDPNSLELTEHEDGISDTEPVRKYIEWANQGIEPPPVFVAEREDGKLNVTNRRRTLAARAAGTKLKGWFSPLNKETGNPLKLGDVVKAAAESGESQDSATDIDPAEDYAKNGTRAKAFKDWFGDSKVVDESGKPLVVYHGTKADFGAFDASGGPIFFGTKEKAGDFTGDGGAILPAYLSIQNPIDLPWVGTLGLYASDIRRYKQEGHDGARMKDGVWVAFDPSQIKSINNRGTFDPSDDRIAYAKPGDPDKYAGRKFDPSQRSLFDDTPPQGPQKRLPGMGGEWMHDPTPQASNRWTNTQTGEHRYQDSKPGSGAAIGTKQMGLFDAPRQQGAETEYAPEESISAPQESAEATPKVAAESQPSDEALERIEKLASTWDAQARKDEGGRGIAVGAENINYRWKADAMRSFAKKVREGVDPAEAAEQAKAEAREWIAKHNARRPKDISWQRWEGAADSAVESAQRMLSQGETTDKPTDEQVRDAIVSGLRQDSSEPMPKLGSDKSPYKGPRRRQTKFELSEPIVGPSGAELTGYEWRYELFEDVDERGEEVIRRVSNWDEAEQSHDTGRNIVHLFGVKDTDGKHHLMSLESALKAMGYTNAADASDVSSIANAMKAKALAQMELDNSEDEYKRRALQDRIESLDDKIERLNKVAADPDNNPDARRDIARKATRLAEHMRDRAGVMTEHVLKKAGKLNEREARREFDRKHKEATQDLYKALGRAGYDGSPGNKTPLADETPEHEVFGRKQPAVPAWTDKQVKKWYQDNFDLVKPAMEKAEEFLREHHPEFGDAGKNPHDISPDAAYWRSRYRDKIGKDANEANAKHSATGAPLINTYLAQGPNGEVVRVNGWDANANDYYAERGFQRISDVNTSTGESLHANHPAATLAPNTLPMKGSAPAPAQEPQPGDTSAVGDAPDPLSDPKLKEAIEDGRVQMRRAAAGGEVSDVNGQFYRGGRIMPVHGAFAGIEKPPTKTKAQGDGELPTAKTEGKEGRGLPTARQRSPEDVEREKAEREERNQWAEIRKGPLGELYWTGDKPEPEAIQSDDPIDFAHQLTGGKVAKETIEKIAPDDLRRILDRESAPKHVIDTDAPPGGWTAKDKVPSSYAQDRVARKLDAYAKQAWTMTEGQYKDKADHFDSTVYNAAVADAIRDGKEVPDAVLDQGDGKFRQFKQKTERFNAMPEAQRQLYDAKTTQITEDDYLEQQRLRRLEQEKTNLANYDEQLKRLKPKAKTPASKRKYEQEKANLESWKRMAQKSIDRLESIKHGSEDINAESWRKSYRDTVKKAISKGEQVPPEVANQHPEFRKAVDARQRYEKGWNTSFKNKSLAVDESRKADRGYKAKRQDGKDMTDDHQQYIETVVDEVEQALGVSLKEAFAATDVTFAHTNGKHPFLSDAGGMYHPTERTVTMGIRFLWMDIKSGAHEIGHWLDYEGGKAMGKSRRVKVSGTRSANVAYASEDEHWNNGVTSLASQLMNNSYDARKLAKAKLKDARTDEEKAEIQKNKTHLGAYWHTPREIWARLFEQYVSEELAGESKLAAEDLKYYRSGPAYWSESAWKQLRPLVKSAIERKLNAIKSTTR